MQVAEDDDDPLAIIIRKACSRELTDLGLTFNSLNIKVVQSEVAEARRRQSAAEAQANAEIVAALQTRRAKEAQLDAERMISDKEREVEQTRASNAALIAQAQAKKQDALAVQRTAELDATVIAQAKADAEKMRIQAQAQAQAQAINITTVAEATAESHSQGERSDRAWVARAYFRYRQIEMLPQIAPAIAQALSKARLVTISGGGTGSGEWKRRGRSDDQPDHGGHPDDARSAAGRRSRRDPRRRKHGVRRSAGPPTLTRGSGT